MRGAVALLLAAMAFSGCSVSDGTYVVLHVQGHLVKSPPDGYECGRIAAPFAHVDPAAGELHIVKGSDFLPGKSWIVVVDNVDIEGSGCAFDPVWAAERNVVPMKEAGTLFQLVQDDRGVRIDGELLQPGQQRTLHVDGSGNVQAGDLTVSLQRLPVSGVHVFASEQELPERTGLIGGFWLNDYPLNPPAGS